MATRSPSLIRPSPGAVVGEYFNSAESVESGLYSLLDEVDSESIADEFGIGTYNGTHDFNPHIRVAIREGLDPSDSLRELADKTDVDEELTYMAASTFSEYTNDRDYRAVVRYLFELLHTPQLYHQRAVQRKRLEWLTRGVVAADTTNLELTRSVVVSGRFVEEGDESYVLNTDESGLRLHLAARVDGEHKHPLGATVTDGEAHESPQFDYLADDVEIFADLDSVIWTYDRGYTLYSRFCEIKHSEDDFVTLMQSNADFEVVEQLEEATVTTKPVTEQGREIIDEEKTHHVRDEMIVLSDTGEEFRRIVLETPDGEELEYLTTLSPSEYDPIDVISIYTLRTVIEILFRELKQYLNVENFHSKSLNGVLFELFSALIGFLLVEWLRQCYPVKAGPARAIQKVRTYWNKSLDSFG